MTILKIGVKIGVNLLKKEADAISKYSPTALNRFEIILKPPAISLSYVDIVCPRVMF